MTAGPGLGARLQALVERIPYIHHLRGSRAVFRREFVGNFKSVRMAVVTALMALLIVGGALGLNSGGGGSQTDLVLFGHPVLPGGVNGTREGVVFASDAWGVPKANFEVALVNSADLPSGARIGSIPAITQRTDADGFARFSNLSGDAYFVGRVVGDSFLNLNLIDFRAVFGQNMSVATNQLDVAARGTPEYLLISAVSAVTGAPLAGAEVLRGTEVVATLDARGFAQVKLPPGQSQVSLRSGSDEAAFITMVPEPAPTLLSGGPDAVLFVVAILIVLLIAPIGTIAIAHDAIARERAQGSIDLVLSRPATRTGILLGKFAGATTSLVIPLWGTLIVGAMAVSAASGKPVTWSFLGAILLASGLYVATFVLLVLIFSTVAKTTSTAVMFGFLVWILFFLVWTLVVQLALIAAGLSPADRGYAELQAWAGILNFNSLYQANVFLAYPKGAQSPFTFQGEPIFPDWGAPVASVVWFFALLALAVWVFNRKAAE